MDARGNIFVYTVPANPPKCFCGGNVQGWTYALLSLYNAARFVSVVFPAFLVDDLVPFDFANWAAEVVFLAIGLWGLFVNLRKHLRKMKFFLVLHVVTLCHEIGFGVARLIIASKGAAESETAKATAISFGLEIGVWLLVTWPTYKFYAYARDHEPPLTVTPNVTTIRVPKPAKARK